MVIYYCQGEHKRGRPLPLRDGKCKECGIVNTVKSTYEDSTINSTGLAYPLDKTIKIKEYEYASKI